MPQAGRDIVAFSRLSHLYEPLAHASLLKLLEREQLCGDMTLTEFGDLAAPYTRSNALGQDIRTAASDAAVSCDV